MTWTRRLLLFLAATCLTLLPRGARAQNEAPIDAALHGLTDRVALTALDITLGQATAFLSDQTAHTVVVDPRYHDLRVSLTGVEGTLAEVVSALCAATDMEARRLDRWIVLSPSARGIAVVGREMRATYAPGLADEQQRLATQRAAAARQAVERLGLGTPEQALSELDDFQLGALNAQGHLTVAQLFPEYYLPLYDVFGDVIEGPAERPASLPEFSGTRVYLDPALRLELRIPVIGGRDGVVWPVQIIPAGEW
ncbi:MAG: hypothetical protein JSV65_13495 [Armatimonadota bacterium]|nr:MAG: hypothetical protein JSV65_13495 [Armatimonadota bacterium]